MTQTTGRRLRRENIYAMIVIFVMMSTAVGGNVWYTRAVDEKNRRDWCELIVASTDLQRKQPITNPDQQRFAQLMERRRQSLGCD